MSNTPNEKPATKLAPLPSKLDGEHEEIELSMGRCKHQIFAVSPTEVRCKKCHAGWMGQGVYKLLEVA